MLRSLMLLNSCQQYDVRMWEKFEATGMEPEAFVSEGETLWRRLGITDRCADILRKNAASGWVDRELDRCEKLGARIITCRDGIYPKALRDLNDAPLLLYVRGEIFSSGGDAIAVVGTRRCSAYATSVAREIGRAAASNGICVISGGAKGIDGASHSGCVEAGGRTIAVFGNGVDVVYPAEHAPLFKKIMERGAIFSEYPLGAKGEAWRFPRRNRIVVGLAARVIVVEAPMKSGAMITARLAGDAGREVWSVPGRIGDERCEGSNRLIFDGAIPMIDMESFFGQVPEQRTLFDERPAGRRDISSLSDAEKTLVALLTSEEGLTIDNLASQAKMGAAEVFGMMSMLSMKGIVSQNGPGRYCLKD